MEEGVDQDEVGRGGIQTLSLTLHALVSISSVDTLPLKL
jgi:hypothetical protein